MGSELQIPLLAVSSRQVENWQLGETGSREPYLQVVLLFLQPKCSFCSTLKLSRITLLPIFIMCQSCLEVKAVYAPGAEGWKVDVEGFVLLAMCSQECSIPHHRDQSIWGALQGTIQRHKTHTRHRSSHQLSIDLQGPQLALLLFRSS